MGKYVLGCEKGFHDFVNSISKEYKIGVVTHTDLDGIASGIFLQKILESKDLKINFIEFLGYGVNVLKGILDRKFDVLFFTDWNLDNYPEDLNDLRKKGRVFVIDHHPVNENLKDKSNFIKTFSEYCSSHCLFDLAKKYFNTKNWEWLACVAMITDYAWNKSEENLDFIKKFYSDVKKDAFIWNSEPGKIAKLISGALIYYKPDFRKVYDLVLKKDLEKLKKAGEIIHKETNKWIEKFREEAEYFPKEKLYFYYASPEYGVTSIVTSDLSSKYFPKDTIIFISDIKGEKDFVKMSARNQTGKLDLGTLLKKCIEGFEDSVAGGHVRASGGSFPKRYLDEFKKRLLQELKK